MCATPIRSNTIDVPEIMAYAEDTGDYALWEEAEACMDSVDADGDGKIGALAAAVSCVLARPVAAAGPRWRFRVPM